MNKQYPVDSYSFIPLSSFFIVIIFILTVLIYIPTPALAVDAFSANTSSKWGTVVDSNGSMSGETDSGWDTPPANNNRLPGETGRVNSVGRHSAWSHGRTKKFVDEDSISYREIKHPTTLKSVKYSGRAEADGRPAMLELYFDGKNVSGKLQAKGSSGRNSRFPSTNISFTHGSLNGVWESDDTTISAFWKGGDYIDGHLIPDYPTSGNLSIKLIERDGEKVVFLHRISSSQYGYVFPLKGVVYTPLDTDNGDTPSAGNGYWDPVGSWSGKYEWQIFDKSHIVLIKLLFTKDGKITSTSTEDNKKPEQDKGTWQRQGNGIKIEWSAASIKEHELDDSIFAFFDGANCLIVKDEDGEVVKIYRDAKNKTNNDSRTTIDPSKIVGIELSRTSLKVAPDNDYPLPEILGKLRGSKKLVKLPKAKVSWSGFTHVSIGSGNKIEVSPLAEPGESGNIMVDVTVGGRLFLAKCKIDVVEEIKYGSFEFATWFKYKNLDSAKRPSKPIGSVVELDGPGGKQYKTLSGSIKGKFDYLEKGTYQIRILSVEIPEDMPDKYVSSSTAHLNSKARTLPSVSSNGKQRWSARTSLFWLMVLKKQPVEEKSNDYCVYGIVTNKGEPIDEIKVTLMNYNGSSMREVNTDEFGQYSINTQGMKHGKYWITALKMMGDNHLSASDGDLMNPGQNPEVFTPLTINLPVINFGEEINIKCKTRKEIFGAKAQ